MPPTSSTGTSSGRASGHLAHLSEALRPERRPWYVRNPAPSLERDFPSDGWYWIPTGGIVAEYLGRTEGSAGHRLRSLLDDADQA